MKISFKKLMLWHRGEIGLFIYLLICGKFEWVLGAWNDFPEDKIFNN